MSQIFATSLMEAERRLWPDGHPDDREPEPAQEPEREEPPTPPPPGLQKQKSKFTLNGLLVLALGVCRIQDLVEALRAR